MELSPSSFFSYHLCSCGSLNYLSVAQLWGHIDATFPGREDLHVSSPTRGTRERGEPVLCDEEQLEREPVLWEQEQLG